MPVALRTPYPTLTDSDGAPLDRGYVYIGQANLNPLANPKQAYWDEALTVPAVSPLRTSGGYLVYNGTPARLYVDGDYSMLATDKRGALVFVCYMISELDVNALLVRPRGSLTRSMLTPDSYDMNLIRESGFYAWVNNGASSIPTGCAANDAFTLEVLSSPDGNGLIEQTIYDMTNGPSNVSYAFNRVSLDAGVTWTAWYNATPGLPRGQTGTNYIPYVDSAGRMGIGRSPTAYTLEVAETVAIGQTGTAGMLILARSSDGVGAGSVAMSGNDFTFNAVAGGNTIWYRSSVEKMRLDTNDYLLVGYGASQGAYRIQSNGSIYMGVGNLAQDSGYLHSFGSVYLRGVSGIGIGVNRLPTTYTLEVQGDIYAIGALRSSELSLVNAALINWVGGAYIRSDATGAKLGVGRSPTTYVLEVQGDIYTTGALRGSGGNAVISTSGRTYTTGILLINTTIAIPAGTYYASMFASAGGVGHIQINTGSGWIDIVTTPIAVYAGLFLISDGTNYRFQATGAAITWYLVQLT